MAASESDPSYWLFEIQHATFLSSRYPDVYSFLDKARSQHGEDRAALEESVLCDLTDQLQRSPALLPARLLDRIHSNKWFKVEDSDDLKAVLEKALAFFTRLLVHIQTGQKHWNAHGRWQHSLT